MKKVVEQVDEQKRDEAISARPKSDQYKTWAIIILGGAVAVLLYLMYSREDLQLVVNGQQIIFSSIILAAILYWLFRKKDIPELPQKDVIAQEAANWHYAAGYGLVDFTLSEVKQISDRRAYVYFPMSEKTLTYEAGKGIVEERWRDIDQEIKSREDADLLKTLNQQRQKDENLKKHLSERGFITEE